MSAEFKKNAYCGGCYDNKPVVLVIGTETLCSSCLRAYAEIVERQE